jgi:hypothetical protein
MSRRASCAHGAQCPSLASGRRRRCALAVHIGRLQYRSRHRAGQSVKSRRAVCAHGRSVKSRRARCALMVLDALFGIRPPPPLSSRRPHRTFVYRSRHRAEQSFKSRRAHCALMVLDAPLASDRRAVAVLSPSTLDVCIPLSPLIVRSWFSMPFLASDRRRRGALARPHRTFLPLSPSCRANVQVETRSYCVHGARCPSLASGRRRCCALAVHIRRLYRSRHHARRTFKSRRARSAHGSRCPLWRRTAAVAVLSPSP